MPKRRRFGVMKVAMPVVLALVALISLLVFQVNSTRRTRQQVFNTLQDAAMAQARAFRICLDGRFESLQAFMGTLYSEQLITSEAQLRSMGKTILATDFSRLMLVDRDGNALTNQGSRSSIREQPVFQKAIAGENAITKSNGDSLDPVPHFVLAVPLLVDGKITGVVAGTYSENVFREIIISETFDGAGYSAICDGDGNIIVTSDWRSLYSQTNFFAALQDTVFISGSFDACQRDIRSGMSGVIEINRSGVTQYAIYMPIGINDWMLLNFVPSTVVDATVSQAMQSGMLLTGVIMCISLGFIVYIFISHQRQQARMEIDRRSLMLSDERFRIALAETSVLIWEYDFESHTVFYSERAEQSTGFPVSMQNVPDVLIEQGSIHPDSVEAFLAMYESLFAGAQRAEGVFRVRMPGHDEWRYSHIHYTSMLDEAGKPYRAIGMSEDVTEKQQAKLAYERELQVQQAMGPDILITALFDATDGRTIRKWFRDEREAVSLFDNQLQTFTSYTAARIVNTDGKPHDWQPTITPEVLQRRFASGQTEMVFEYLRRMPDGTERYVEDASHLIIDPDSGHLMMFSCIKDIDSVHRQQIALRSAAESDSMTGLLNHEAALAQIRAVIDAYIEGSMHALFVIDIDDFKTVNDTFGHQAGDDVIKHIATLLRGAFRESDIIGRIGGDEFIALMRNAGSMQAVRRKAQELIDTLQCNYRIGEYVIPLSASVGICTCESAAQSVDLLYRDADASLYKSKTAGKNRYTLLSGGDILIGKPQTIGGVASDVHLRTLLDSFDGGVLMAEIREDIRIVFATSRLYSMLGIDAETARMPGNRILERVVKEDQQPLLASVFDVVRTGKQLDSTYRVHTATGAIAWRHLTGSRLPEQSDGIDRILGIVTDITEKKRGELTLAAARRQFDAPLQAALIRLADIAYEYIALIDTRLTALTLLGTGALVPSPLVPKDGMLYEDYRANTVETYVSASERDDARISLSLEVVINALHTLPVYTCIYAVNDASNPNCRKKWQFTYLDETMQTIVLTRSDVTDTYLAEVDPVTGIYNRYKIAEHIRHALAEHPDIDYVLVRTDIDNFKVFNDIYGTEAGDRLLRSFADYLRSLYFKVPMLLYGHIEADHFLCLLPSDALQNSPSVSEAIAWLAEQNPEFAYSPRVGVYRIDDRAIDVSLMSDRAYLALRSIKGKYGEHVAVYNECMRRQLLGEQEIVNQMHGALTSEQFDIYLQPQYDYVTGEITGAEALARWIHPEKGVLAPDTFIPAFERNGFIKQLDAYIWKRACTVLAKWKAAGEPLVPISVNVSRIDIGDHGILATLENLMQAYALSPDLLRLEITESAYLENSQQVISVVGKLRAMGFAVEMDDFGSGYSSLHMLSDVQVDTLKLDMYFLSEMNDNLRSNDILNCIIRMTRWLRLPVIAEGIETKEQAEYLKSIGCVRMQGYLFGKPMPVADFERIKATAQIAPIERLVHMDAKQEAAYREAAAQAVRFFAEAQDGALIVEYCNGNIEALRINDRFFEICGLRNQMLTPWALHMQDLLAVESQRRAIAMLTDAIATGAETHCILESRRLKSTEILSFACTAQFVTQQSSGSILFIRVRRL